MAVELHHMTGNGPSSSASFDPDVYVGQLLSCHYKWVKLTLDYLHQTFSEGSVQGRELLEVGCGPTVHCVLSASRAFSRITMADVSTTNLAAVRQWLLQDDLGQWTRTLEHVAKLEGHPRPSEGAREVARRVKTSVRRLVQCDVLRDPILPATTCEQYDCVLTSLCLEAAVTSLVSYRDVLKKVVSFVRPGGSFIMIGVLGCASYVVGDRTLASLSLTQKDVCNALVMAGVERCTWNPVAKWNSAEDVNGNGWTGAFMVRGVCR